MNDYERVSRIIEFIGDNFRKQPDLDELARVAGLSRFHFHRLFSRWAGTTPKCFVQHLTALEAGRLLRSGRNVLATSLDVGLSGPGRLHDLCVQLDAASPGEIRSGGEGWEIRAGVAATPFGDAFVAVGPRGLCRLAFPASHDDREGLWRELSTLWPQAKILRDNDSAAAMARKIFAERDDGGSGEALKVYLRGTEFQLKVWRALIEIPAGETRSYREIARVIDVPKGSRAVGSAAGSNPVGIVIPCHRVIHTTGSIGNYYWGALRKKAILAWERSYGEIMLNSSRG